MFKSRARTAISLVVIWAVAGAGIWIVRSSRPTPEKLTAWLERNAIAEALPLRRSEILEKTAAQLNRLTFEQRQELRKSGSVRSFFEQLTPEERRLTPEERSRFLDLTLPEGFRQLMLALNKMDETRRRKIVQRALDDIRTDNPELAARLADKDVQKIISQGLSSFYEEADAGVKLDFAPVIEEIQRATQSLR